MLALPIAPGATSRHPNLLFTPNHPPLPQQHVRQPLHHGIPHSANPINLPSQIPLPSMLSRKRNTLGHLQTDFAFNHPSAKSDAVPQILPFLAKDLPSPTSRPGQRRSASLSKLDIPSSARVNTGHHSPSRRRPLQPRIATNRSLGRHRHPLFNQSDDEEDISVSRAVRNAHPKIWDTLLSTPLKTPARKNFDFDRALLKLKPAKFDTQEYPSSSDEDGPGQLRGRGHARAGADISPISTSPSTAVSYSVSRTSSAASLTIPLPEIVVLASSIIEGSPFAERAVHVTKSLDAPPRHGRSLSPYSPAIPASLLRENRYSSSSSSSASSTISSAGDEASSPYSVLTTPSTSPEASFLPHLKYIERSPLSSSPQLAAPCVPHPRDSHHLGLLPVEPRTDPLSLEVASTHTNFIAGNHASLPKQNESPYRRLSVTSTLEDEGSLTGAWDALCGFSKLFVDGYGASTLESSPLVRQEVEISGDSDPSLSVQTGNMQFTPWDVKPYGYRVGAAEVRTVFGRDTEEALSETHSQPSTSETIMNWFDSALDFVNPPLDAPYGLTAPTSTDIPRFSGSRGAFGPSLVAPIPSQRQHSSSPMFRSSSSRSRRRRKHEGKRPPSPPLAAIVALQRYPVIPYNPPGDTKPWEEVFPKVRDTSRIWWYDMMPPSEKDFKVDGEVAISSSVVRPACYSRSIVQAPSRLQSPRPPSRSSFDQPRSSSRSEKSTRRRRSPSSECRGRPAGGPSRRRRSPSTHRRSGCAVSGSTPRSSESSRGRSRITRPCFDSSVPSLNSATKPIRSSKATTPSSTTTPSSSSSGSLPTPALVKRKARLSSLHRPPSEHSFAPSIYYVWALKTSFMHDRNLAGIPALRIMALAKAYEGGSSTPTSTEALIPSAM